MTPEEMETAIKANAEETKTLKEANEKLTKEVAGAEESLQKQQQRTGDALKEMKEKGGVPKEKLDKIKERKENVDVSQAQSTTKTDSREG